MEIASHRVQRAGCAIHVGAGYVGRRGGLGFHLLYFFVFVFLSGAIVYCPFVVYYFVLFFFVVLLCIVLRSICPSPPLAAGD